MTYLEEFKNQINNRNFTKFLQLWEEYSSSDQVDAEEFLQMLKAVKNSEFAKQFGQLIETALPLWKTIQDKEESYAVLRALIDLQNTNSPTFADLAIQALKERYEQQPNYNERLRIVGLRTRENFQGAITYFDLLAHMEKGKFVYHPGGWGTGEILDISPVRQQVTIEFENVSGRKYLTFENAFKALIPLKEDHFLARRFAHPDALEEEARQDPVGVIKLLLKDLGPKNAQEIKEELEELVIPENDWSRWWQATRGKLKKDPLIETPEVLRDPFRLRTSELSHQDRLDSTIHSKSSVDEVIASAYNFLRDFPDARKQQDVWDSLKEKLLAQLKVPGITLGQELQICICLENQFGHEIESKSTKELIKQLENVEQVINGIDIIALQKRALTLVGELRQDWVKIFLNLIVLLKHSALRDYILKELCQSEYRETFEQFLAKLLRHPETHPDFFVWYFQKILGEEKDQLPLSSKEGQCQLFDAFLVLLSIVESKPEYRDLTKKMYTILSGKRYALVRAIMEDASLEYVKEFLLLASKCHTLTDHDRKILLSLAAVVHPILGKDQKRSQDAMMHVIWATEEGYRRVQEQVQHLGTVEVVQNAREIEAARALGDLRENSEYKSALEKRSRLQGQLKALSDQLKRARIITQADVSANEVGVGSIVEVLDEKGNSTTYTILGPWEANPENNILSFQSQLAQTLIGSKKGDSIDFRGEQLKIKSLSTYFDKK